MFFLTVSKPQTMSISTMLSASQSPAQPTALASTDSAKTYNNLLHTTGPGLEGQFPSQSPIIPADVQLSNSDAAVGSAMHTGKESKALGNGDPSTGATTVNQKTISSHLPQLSMPPAPATFNDPANSSEFAAADATDADPLIVTPESISHANEPAYLSEKKKYLGIRGERIGFILDQDDALVTSHRDAGHLAMIGKYRARTDVLRKRASAELHEQALARINLYDEYLAKENKRKSNKLAAERRRIKRAERKAAAIAAAVVNRSSVGSDNEGSKVDGATGDTNGSAEVTTKHSKRKSAVKKDDHNEPKKARGSKRKNDEEHATHPIKIRLVSPTSDNLDTVESTPSSPPNAKDKRKGPSQKEVRAIARLYQSTYESIWKDMARRDAAKTFKQIQSISNVQKSNLKKTSVLASKEARRYQFRTNKNMKDLQARARRGMKEMLAFWKKNEKEERDLRKRAEKEALDLAKKEEEERESKRQARKLNFLITQTELYSHFIGRKIKTDELEGNDPSGRDDDDDGDNVDVGIARHANELDFDAVDDSELAATARANAQSAVLAAQAKARQFDGNDGGQANEADIDDDELNFQNPTSLGDIQIPQPKMLRCQLKEYQIKGLNWLANLYEQGINGILADEMGLGKTVQSISVMAYLAETHNIWGPFLVIAPASTLHNWQQEITKFIPDFKALPYWGSGKDRKVLRKFWDRKQVTYTQDSPFHVLITSYQLVVADAQYLQRIKWQYMILDEAQAIKSSSSSRWKSLLSFQCRNRLLLTGTPIQNSMQELWALLHFIMPSLFDSHEEFSEWFSKDIESHATSNTKLNEQQLRRLHMILKPFMLRRVKKNVQQELGDKIEIDLYCDLTNRQRALYKMLKSQISVLDLIQKAAAGSDEGTRSLMNLVMQFRKVCNHPDLFERADVKSAFNFAKFAQTVSIARDPSIIDLGYTCFNEIEYQVPAIFQQDGGFLDVPSDGSSAGFKNYFLNNTLSIWNPDWASNRQGHQDMFSWVRFSGASIGEIRKTAFQDILIRAIHSERPQSRTEYQSFYDDGNYEGYDRMFLINQPLESRLSSDKVQSLMTIREDYSQRQYYNVMPTGYFPKVLCPPISMIMSNKVFTVDQQDLLFNQKIRESFQPMTLDQEWGLLQSGLKPADFMKSDLYPPAPSRQGYTTISLPSMAKFVTDSGKLKKLDELLVQLKANDHRVLIYFQMTKMMDMMEEYLTYRQYKYCRLDGSSKLSERRDLVNDWQTKPELFVFLLSTRAGGLGINLTAADTVVFYDSDWNPTIDSQAMDRAHRLGQTRQVTVYRLLVKGTIEERMRDRAKQKEHVQNVVMEGGDGAKANAGVDFQKPGREAAYWLLDDDEAANQALRRSEAESKVSASGNGKNSSITLEEMYHENEGNFDEGSTGLNTSATVSRVPTPKPKKAQI